MKLSLSRQRRGPRHAHLTVEALEERQLLSAGNLPFGISDDQLTGGILVQYRNDTQPTLVRPADGLSVSDALATYQADGNVLFAEADVRVGLNRLPNDFSFNRLYGLHNTGQTGGVLDADIDAAEAWDVATGSSKTVVAVVDTGIDYRHPDLYLNVWINQREIPTSIKANLADLDGDGLITFYDLNDTRNQGTGKITDKNANGRIDGGDLLYTTAQGGWADGIDNDPNGYRDDLIGWDFVNNDNNPLDDNGHGTHVAGTIGAIGNNGTGVAGVVWRVQIMATKFLDSYGSGSLSAAVSAVNYSVNNGARVANHSWGGGYYSQSLYNAMNNARLAGQIIVAAAGNEGANNDAIGSYPSNYALSNIVAVAATDHRDLLPYFSNYGATQVDIGTPGVSIYSTVPGGYAYLDGTSMATPHVTGAFALLISANPNLTAQQAIDAVLQGGDARSSLAGRTTTGRRLNVAGALARVTTPADTQGAYVVSFTPNATGARAVSSVRIVFNEQILTNSFTANDVVFTGPNGQVISVLGVAAVGTTGREFDITFASQSAPGTYRMVMGPNILDRGGNNPMDQDRDGIEGEVPQDAYTGTFSINPVYTYSSATLIGISDGYRSIGRVTVDRDVTIADLNVRIDINHTWDGDLKIYLRGPDGTLVVLSNRRGGSGDNFRNTIFDDEATTAIANGAAPFTGSFRPDQVLSTFDGKNARGSWELWIDDLAAGDVGRLNSWSLTVEGAGSGPAGRSLRPTAGVTTRIDAAEGSGVSTNLSDPVRVVQTDNEDLVSASLSGGSRETTIAAVPTTARRMEQSLSGLERQAVDGVFGRLSVSGLSRFLSSGQRVRGGDALFGLENLFANDRFAIL